MAKFQISGVIDLKEVEHIDPSQLIKVAVTRNCQVIQSVLVKQQEEMRQFKWEIAFETQTERPVGVNVVAGPDVPDERMGSAEAYKVRVPARAFENGRARVELAISDRIYRRWLAFCRTYTLRGRVVCRQLRWDAIEQQFIPCESPVRGALVTAYDVDRIWWWCRSGAVGSDYTDLNGNFEIEFRWCCWSWGPWYLKDWRVDPALVRRIQELSKLAATPIPLPAPSLELDLGIFDSIASRMEIERLDAPAAQPSAASPQRITEIGRQLAARLPAAGLRELRVWPWWPHWDCRPDIIFKATQDCGEGEVVIYEEGCGDARWNVPAELPGITLVANENACCAPCCTQPPDEDCLVFQGVGCGGYPMTQIEQDMASALVGYGNPGNLDRPFGHTIRLLGMFGDGSAVDFYKLQRRRYLPATATWTAWGDIPADQLASFTRLHWLGWPPPLHLPQTVAPQLVDGEMVIKTTRRFRAENPAIVDTVDPTADDWLAQWATARVQIEPATGNTVETPLVADGLYELRVVGYEFDAAANHLVNPRVMPICPSENAPVDPAAHATLRLRIDNRNAISAPGTVHVDTQEPASDYPNVCAVVKNEGEPSQECISACGVVSVVAGDTLTIHFRASDEDGHLERYTLNAHWAESETFSLLGVGTIAADPDALFGPTYASTFVGAQGMHRAGLPATDRERSRPFWNGGSFKVTVTVGNPVPGTGHQVFETCCAYLLRLRVWKRTTDGCAASQHFHVNWSEFSFTVVRADLPCAAGLFAAARGEAASK